MKNVVTVAHRKLMSMVLGILSVFKRLMCFLNIRRRKRDSGAPILPLTNDNITVPQSVPSMDTTPFAPPQTLDDTQEELESWDAWGSEGQQENLHSNGSQQQKFHSNATNSFNQDAEEATEVDFFQDMQPSIRRTQKILIRKKEEFSNQGFSSRLAMASDIPMATSNELETWEDNGESAWAEEAEEDHSWEAEEILKDRKRKEREQRLLEHHRKKVERSRTSSNSSSHRPVQLSAVRLS
ncbi:hypothetical protein CAPTEDRAFT_220212 [Capitella teleta]|uniref:Receptor-binding cancer antigen expressed on SiSo cells n=1 Tax=Capitella teleta TaxID=283909 RepID=R7T5L7_CAPTE|nr:hypothetical protein CAPTEDRAFT_220212 [Capitella teleta]|eukprot:ELT88659.1 hypothetical protein CAPTEDRAFT_220212 [Capitella teleta]